MQKEVTIPRDVAFEMVSTFERLESLSSTLEELLDEKSMKGIREGIEDMKKGNTVKVKPEEIEKLLS